MMGEAVHKIGIGPMTGKIILIGRNVDVISQSTMKLTIQYQSNQMYQLCQLCQSSHPLEIHQMEHTTATGITMIHVKLSNGNAISSQLFLLAVVVTTKPTAHATAPTTLTVQVVVKMRLRTAQFTRYAESETIQNAHLINNNTHQLMMIGLITCIPVAIARSPRERESATSPMTTPSKPINSSQTRHTMLCVIVPCSKTALRFHLLFPPFLPVVETAVSLVKTFSCYNSKLLTSLLIFSTKRTSPICLCQLFKITPPESLTLSQKYQTQLA